MRIIPAIDIIDGKCVRLTQGRFTEKIEYASDPTEMAQRFQDHGVQFLHLVDLDGARTGRITNYKTLERIATATDLTIDFGGGLSMDEDIRIAFECGATQVTGGSIAAKEEETFLRWLNQYGSDKIILGADARNEKIAVTGWQDTTETKLIPYIQGYVQKGVQYVISTDIAKDGMLQGPATDTYRAILETANSLVSSEEQTDKEAAVMNIHLIASGGISNMDDVLAIEEVGCEGVIIGKAIYENRIRLKELENFILEK
ncbi:MAG: 1-(5-phosphoribosyl)-5-[(5-phosphoribosylamino)methylideneamino] imidazole-4-carboxamide isomerase [Flavobacteriaceae bacterium]|nr:1-(5-phosphoribosyl)-5-[(5-phosphoribosylamino)methylideneamino] imidazole-4-carboxamide isomerase [Flavobacteriaceae bacterium]MDH3795360.1 1-(5-phosphoribosyl)-5-[(5-phosphoribosylamino)methylideneamino] imidazole-4-carboxamide isomerase [Flavobacteriaceae bacterium]